MACLQGLAAIDLGITRVHLETDALQVQQAVESQRWDLSLAIGRRSDKRNQGASVPELC